MKAAAQKMAVMDRRVQSLEQRVSILQKEQAAWKAGHDKAMACFTLEELLKDAADLYENICRIDEFWHLTVYEHPDAFDPQFSDVLKSLFVRWHEIAGGILASVNEMHAEFVSRGFDTARIARITDFHAQCGAILNPSEVETDLADRALELHRAGATEAM